MPNPVYLFVREVMQLPEVRKKLDEVADRLASRLATVVAQSGHASKDARVNRSAGTRPKGRPFSQVGMSQIRRLDAQGELARALDPQARTNAKLRATARSPRV